MSKARYGKPRTRYEKVELLLLCGFVVVFVGGMLLIGFVNGWGPR